MITWKGAIQYIWDEYSLLAALCAIALLALLGLGTISYWFWKWVFNEIWEDV